MAVETRREPLEPLAVGPFAGDHDAQRGLALRGLDQQVDPLRAIEPVHRQDVALRLGLAVGERLRRVRQHLRLDAVEALQAIGDVARGREHLARLAERDGVETLDRAARRAVLGRLVELPELGAVVVVRLPELVQHPGDLVRVPDAVGGELRRDHAVDRAAVGLGQVDEPPEERLVEDAGAGVPLERDADDLRFVSAPAQRGDEIVGHQLRAAPHERHLRRRDDDPHGRSSRLTRSSRSSISFRTASLNAR